MGLSGIDLSASTPFGSITNVAGVSVGHHQRTGRGWQTGTTVVAVPAGATPGVDVRGGGPGTRETDALRPENLIPHIHAITLTGGSAYGLAAADGTMRALEAAGLGFPVADHVVPVVPAAVIFDLGRGGDVMRRPDASFGERATRAALARRTPPGWGSVGAGTGARSGGLQGGVGTASTQVDIDGRTVTVGAVAVVNSNGTAINPATGHPWEPSGARFARCNAAHKAALQAAAAGPAELALNTTIGVVATDATLSKAMATKLAAVSHDGLARAIRPAHSMTDGDTIFALSTGDIELPGPDNSEHLAAINAVLATGADMFAAACTHAVVSARTIGSVPAWSDLTASQPHVDF